MPAFDLIPVDSIWGRLTVIGGPIREHGKMIRYPCRCQCGQQTVSVGAQLRNGTASSCGCARKDALRRIKTTHGFSKTKLHVVWRGMNARCGNRNHISYKYYGAKGIFVGKEFSDFTRFMRWALANGYEDGLTLERRNGSRGYTPGNCVWANHTIQNRNSSHVHKVAFQGRELCLTEWEEVTGIKASTIKNRLRKGWPIWRALTKGRVK